MEEMHLLVLMDLPNLQDQQPDYFNGIPDSQPLGPKEIFLIKDHKAIQAKLVKLDNQVIQGKLAELLQKASLADVHAPRNLPNQVDPNRNNLVIVVHHLQVVILVVRAG